MSEAQEQATVIEWCTCKGVPVYHVPNGGSRDKREAANLKKQGVKAGVPDLCVPVARCGYHSLYIEMKTPKGRVTPNQEKWLSLLDAQDMCAVVCRSAGEAIGFIERYMGGEL